MKQLQFAKISTAVSSKWYELGIALLDDDQVGQLKVIKADSDELTRQCSEMLSYWLETHSDVTWNDLVAGLRAPGVEMNELATTIEGQLTGIHNKCSSCINHFLIVHIADTSIKAQCHLDTLIVRSQPTICWQPVKRML